MALSDALTDLATKAREAEDNARDAKQKSQAELQEKVAAAKQAADKQVAELRARREADAAIGAGEWDALQQSWNDHVASIRAKIDERKAEHDRNKAEAEDAEAYAAYAIDFAASAIEEAEYAVLDAQLARTEADALTAA